MTQQPSPENKRKSGGKPPPEHRFRKGQSGNPGGRPKEVAEVRELARQHTIEAIEKLAHWMRSDNAKASVAACGVLLDRAWGKAPQALTGEGGEGAVVVQVITGVPRGNRNAAP